MIDQQDFLTLEHELLNHCGQEVPRPGLGRISALLNHYVKRVQSRGVEVVTVAGTNGKGQTIMTLAEILKRQNKKYTLWTSPHIHSLSERFQSYCGPIEFECFKKLYKRVHRDCEELAISLTYYEFLFAIFVYWSEQSDIEYVLLEVGLGGRLDAVNIFDADIALLTSISRDHTEYLGPYYRNILAEKIAVARSDKLLISMLSLNYLKMIAEQYCRKNAVVYIDADKKFQTDADYRDNYQRRNQFLAFEAALALIPTLQSEFTFSKMLKQLDDFSLKARHQVLTVMQKDWYFTAAHNLDGIRNYIHFLKDQSYNLKDKSFDVCLLGLTKRPKADVLAIVKVLELAKAQGYFTKLILCEFDHWRALKWQSIDNQIRGQDYRQVIKDETQHNSKALVLGSFFFIDAVQSWLSAHSNT